MRTAPTGRLLALDELVADHRLAPGERQGCDTEDLAAQLFAVLSDQLAGVPAALLESSDHARTAQPARSAQSILAFSFGARAATVTHLKGWTRMTTPAGTTERRQPFFSWLAENWTTQTNQSPGEQGSDEAAGGRPDPKQPLRDTPRFALGWVGWLGYELKREAGAADLDDTVTLDGTVTPDGAMDPDSGVDLAGSVDGAGMVAEQSSPPAQEAGLFRATHAVVIHHRTGDLELQCLDPTAESDWQEQVTRALARVAPGVATESRPGAAILRDVVLRDSRSAYLAAIEEAKREITAGNSYEICLTTAVTGTLAPGHARGVDLFARLRARNQAPFTAFLSIGETEILSTSPERFLSVSAGGTVRSEPIKGTRPRGATAAADRVLIEDLRTHPKDRAENVMIADLTRNDLSIHAVPGSLRTERLCAVETYPSVHQLVSTVSARIPDEVPRARVVADAFPPGSMTGAPKISTMDILQRLETGARGPYSGVAGYFSMNGAADLAVLIRTAVLSGDSDARRFHLGLGGAITADSDPAEEWEEIRTKSRGVLEALGAEFPDSAVGASR